MQMVLTISALMLSAFAVGASIAALHVQYKLQKQQTALNKRCKQIESRMNPIRLNFLLNAYNISVEKEEYKCAGDILSIIKQEYPEESKKIIH